MLSERRESDRDPADEFVAIVVDGTGAIFTRCRMTNVSGAGAQLQIRQRYDIPDKFTLVLMKGATIRRSCEIAWRRDDLMGVRFVRLMNNKK
jgi:hypothetical protein